MRMNRYDYEDFTDYKLVNYFLRNEKAFDKYPY